MPLIKTSIIFFFRRIFAIRPFFLFSTCLIFLVILWSLGIFFTCAGQCRPLKAYWDKSIPGKCIDSNKLFIVNQGFNIAIDFILLGIPLPIIWKLHTVWQEKLELTLLFTVGIFVCFASIYRIVVLFYIDPSDTTCKSFSLTPFFFFFFFFFWLTFIQL